MNNLIRKFATDPDKEKKGVVHKLGDGISITVARLNNPLHVEVMAKLRTPFADKLDAGIPIPDAEWKGILAKATAETILIGWEGVTDDAGKVIPYSVEEAEKILLDPEMADFTSLVSRFAANGDHFRKYAKAVAGKKPARR